MGPHNTRATVYSSVPGVCSSSDPAAVLMARSRSNSSNSSGSQSGFMGMCEFLDEVQSDPSAHPAEAFEWASPGATCTVHRPANLLRSCDLREGGKWLLTPVNRAAPDADCLASRLVNGFRAMSDVHTTIAQLAGQDVGQLMSSQAALVAAMQGELQPSMCYAIRFVQEFVALLEASSAAVSPELQSALESLQVSVDASSGADVCHTKSYLLHYCDAEGTQLATEVNIKVHQAESVNQVGTTIWPAGLFLAELCFTYPQLIRGKRVIELGAGVGLTGVF